MQLAHVAKHGQHIGRNHVEDVGQVDQHLWPGNERERDGNESNALRETENELELHEESAYARKR